MERPRSWRRIAVSDSTSLSQTFEFSAFSLGRISRTSNHFEFSGVSPSMRLSLRGVSLVVHRFGSTILSGDSDNCITVVPVIPSKPHATSGFFPCGPVTRFRPLQRFCPNAHVCHIHLAHGNHVGRARFTVGNQNPTFAPETEN